MLFEGEVGRGEPGHCNDSDVSRQECSINLRSATGRKYAAGLVKQSMSTPLTGLVELALWMRIDGSFAKALSRVESAASLLSMHVALERYAMA